tara:strand:- start:2866 stop:3132 length:267 start_codon:yes stop_codon:yes gene_type:complete
MFHIVYVLISKKDKGIYIGLTKNLKQRLKEHASGYTESTRDRRPLELIYFEGYITRKEAMQREKYLKTGWGGEYMKKVVRNYLNKPKN